MKYWKLMVSQHNQLIAFKYMQGFPESLNGLSGDQ